VGDYPVHLIHMRSIPDEDLEKMDSDLKYVLGMLKCSRSKRKYRAFIEKNKDYFRRIPRSAVDVLDVFMNIKGVMQYLQYIENEENGEEETDMCKALDDIVKDSEKRGEKRGRAEGEKLGEKRGRQEGRQEGRESNTILSITNLMKNLHLTAEQAMEALEVPQSQRQKYKGLLPAKG
jgi:flagellar biosynthesis/type III secretory pathway protein FliH